MTGSRTWSDTTIIRDALATVWHPHNTLVHELADTGATALAAQCWTHWGGHTEPHPPLHPRRPLNRSDADVCLAFIQSKTASALACARLAHRAGIPVRLFRTGPGALTVPAPRKDLECPRPQPLPLPLP